MGNGKLSIGVLASGKGSNLQVLIDAAEAGQLDVNIAVVISDNEQAHALERARRHGIEAVCLPSARFRTKLEPEVERQYVQCLRDHGVELVVLAGFMRMVKEILLEAYHGRIINIHPSLLPAFPGLESWKQALEYGVKVTGCTVHFVDPGMDTGPIILQEAVTVQDNDAPESLHERIQAKEHLLLPRAVQLFAQARLSIQGRRVVIK